MKGEQKVFTSPYLRGLHYVILLAAVAAKCTGLHGGQVKLQASRVHIVSCHSCHVRALFLDGLRARPRTREQNGENHLPDKIYFIVFYCGAARTLLNFY